MLKASPNQATHIHPIVILTRGKAHELGHQIRLPRRVRRHKYVPHRGPCLEGASPDYLVVDGRKPFQATERLPLLHAPL